METKTIRQGEMVLYQLRSQLLSPSRHKFGLHLPSGHRSMAAVVAVVALYGMAETIRAHALRNGLTGEMAAVEWRNLANYHLYALRMARTHVQRTRAYDELLKREFAVSQDRYHPGFLNLRYRLQRQWSTMDKGLINDAVVEAFVDFYNKAVYGDTPSIRNLYGYLSGCAKNHLRARRRTEVWENPYPDEMSDWQIEAIPYTSDLLAEAAEYLQYLRESSFEEWLLFKLRAIDELPYQRIADRLGISEGAAKVRYFRLLDKMKKYFNK